MSADDTKSLSLSLVPRSFGECESLAKTLSASSLLPAALKGKVPEVLMTILAGQELGIPPIAALRSIHVIEGKTVLSADIMQAVVLGNGSAKYVKRISASDTESTYETLRVGDVEPRRMTWTIEMAKKAGLFPTKTNWACYPRQMLSARCKAELLRDVYADALAGCFTPEESDGWSDQPSTVVPYKAPEDVIDAEFVDVPSARSPLGVSFAALRDTLIADINAAPTKDALEVLLTRFSDLPKATAKVERAAAYAVYKSRLLVVERLETITDAVVVNPLSDEALDAAVAKDAAA